MIQSRTEPQLACRRKLEDLRRLLTLNEHKPARTHMGSSKDFINVTQPLPFRLASENPTARCSRKKTSEKLRIMDITQLFHPKGQKSRQDQENSAKENIDGNVVHHRPMTKEIQIQKKVDGGSRRKLEEELAASQKESQRLKMELHFMAQN